MKKILYGILILLVLVVVGIGVAVVVIPKETYVAQIQSAVKDATGRDLTIGGDISFGIWPTLALEVNDVAFANAPGASTPAMATLDKLAFELDMAQALTGAIAVDTFVLTRPVINLEVDAQGNPNWAIGGDGDSSAASAGSADGADAGNDGSPVEIIDPGLEIRLGEVRLIDATITYSDQTSGMSERIDAVTMELSLPSLDDPFGAKGGLTWNGERIDLDLSTGPLRALAAGASSKVAVGIKADPVALRFDGSVSIAGEPKAGGTLDLNLPSIRGLAAWMRNPLPKDAGGSGLGPLGITGTVGVDGKKYAFTDARINIDAIKSTGSLVADLTGTKPDIVATLDVETLDMNPYLSTGDGAAPAAASGGEAAAAGAAPEDWSDEPIDLSGLHQANAKLDLTVAGIRVQDIKIGKGAVGVTLRDGLFNAALKQLNLYEGMITADVVVDARNATPALSKSATLSAVQALPLLTDAARFDRLEGRGDANISVTTSGKSQAQMIRNLNGKGGFGFRDGAIIGINIGAMVRNLATAFLDASAAETVKTDFAELTGTFDIKNGVLTNNDFNLLAPALRVTGAGSTDINTRTVTYRVEPKLVGSLSGQGGAADASGIAVPINVTGPWHALDYQPDLLGAVNLDAAGQLLEDAGRAAVDGAVGDVEKAVEGLATGAAGTVTEGLDAAVGGTVDKAVGGAVQDILGGGSSSGDAAPAASGIGDALGGAVGGLLGGRSSQSAPAPEPQPAPQQPAQQQPAQQQPAPQKSEPKEILEDTGKALRGLFN